MSGAGKTVCVTGASGFIASHLVKLLLQQGYSVKASVRSPNNATKVEHLLKLEGAKERLHLFKADLLEDGSFDAAIDGCDGVFHTASPFLTAVADPQLGDAKKILGMEIIRDRLSGVIRLSQTSYLLKVSKNFFMDKSKAVITPLGMHFKLSSMDSPKTDEESQAMMSIPYANAVGGLMYLMVCTRPDIIYAVSVVSRFLSNPGRQQLEGIKWILRYLNGTKDVGLVFGMCSKQESVIDGFVDSDFAKDVDKGRSITGYVFKVLGGTVSWKSKLAACSSTVYYRGRIYCSN